MKVKKSGFAIAFAILVLVLFSGCDVLPQDLGALFSDSAVIEDKLEGYVILKNYNDGEVLYAEEWATLDAGFVENSDGSKRYDIYSFDKTKINKMDLRFTELIFNCKKNGTSFEEGRHYGVAEFNLKDYKNGEAQVKFYISDVPHTLYFHSAAKD